MAIMTNHVQMAALTLKYETMIESRKMAGIVKRHQEEARPGHTRGRGRQGQLQLLVHG